MLIEPIQYWRVASWHFKKKFNMMVLLHSLQALKASMKPQAEWVRGLRQTTQLHNPRSIGVLFISNYLIIFANKIEEICLAISNLEFLEHYPQLQIRYLVGAKILVIWCKSALDLQSNYSKPVSCLLWCVGYKYLQYL